MELNLAMVTGKPIYIWYIEAYNKVSRYCKKCSLNK